MKSNWNLLKAGALLLALPMMATAAVSASQWVNDTAPIDLNVEVAAVESSIGVTRVHAVALNSSGAIEGRVASMDAQGTQGISELSVFFMKNGIVVQETTTSSDGSFRVEGLSEGNYSFVASGENGFAAYGVKVVGETAGVDNVMEASAVAPGVAVVKQILDSNLPKEFAVASTSTVDQAVVGANRVNLLDGKLVGTVRSLDNASVEGTLVHILSGDKQVAKVETNKDGSFSIENFTPGVYSFVSTGPSGYAAVSFEAVNESTDDVEIPVAISPAAAIQEFGFSDSLDVCTTCGTNAGYSDVVYDSTPTYQESFAPVEYASESIGCGGACGGSCGSAGNFSNFSSGTCGACNAGASAGGRLFGGGGGLFGGGGGGGLFGGGGGRFGRLALLGALAGGIVAIAVDDDDDGQVVVLSSPF